HGVRRTDTSHTCHPVPWSARRRWLGVPRKGYASAGRQRKLHSRRYDRLSSAKGLAWAGGLAVVLQLSRTMDGFELRFTLSRYRAAYPDWQWQLLSPA